MRFPHGLYQERPTEVMIHLVDLSPCECVSVESIMIFEMLSMVALMPTDYVDLAF